MAWEYAQMFHTRLVASRPPLASWPSDVSTASSTYDEIVGSAGDSLSQVFSLTALEILQGSLTWM